ncbi:MAG: PAS domain S-box protein [Rhodomicrobium sp.]|nr:PAS domain S-box protein [Rhodomicrobium sp.]
MLIVEDSEDDAILQARYLKSCGFDPKWQRVDRLDDLSEAVEDRRWDLVLCDLSMPQLTPFMAVDCVRQVNPDIPIIIVTGAVPKGDAENLTEQLLQYGVQDVVLKSNLQRLKKVIARELALAQSRRERMAAELRLALALEKLSQGVALYDENFRLITFNSSYKAILDRIQDDVVPGISYADLIEKALDSGQFTARQKGNEDTLERLMSYDKANGEPFIHHLHDGRWVEVQRHRTEDGGIVTITTDITENKQREAALLRQAGELAEINENLTEEIERRQATEEALQEIQNRAAAILESAVDGMITFNENYIIETVNPAAQKIFGYSADELGGMHVHHLMLLGGHVGRAGNRADPAVSAALDLRNTSIRMVNGWRKSGEAFPVELTISPVQLRDRRIYTGIIRDVTERTKLDRLKSEFVSVVSHELRTPLTSVRGALALLNTGVAGELPVKARSMVSIGLQNSERLLRLINDILDMEKIESGKMEFDFDAVTVRSLIDAAVAENRTFLDQLKLSVETVFDGKPEIAVRGDNGRLMQVLANLISNAAKYSPEGGVVIVGAKAEDATVRLWVKDEGPGIPESFHQRIFQKFSQADSSDTRQKGGTGLGLSIAKAIVEHHGGTIGFETAEGKGTTFFFDLPVYEAAAQAECARRTA